MTMTAWLTGSCSAFFLLAGAMHEFRPTRKASIGNKADALGRPAEGPWKAFACKLDPQGHLKDVSLML